LPSQRIPDGPDSLELPQIPAKIPLAHPDRIRQRGQRDAVGMSPENQQDVHRLANAHRSHLLACQVVDFNGLLTECTHDGCNHLIERCCCALRRHEFK
jgi:hypothetical protein